MVNSFPTPGRNLLSCRCARPDHPLVTGVCAHSPVQLSRNFMAPLSRYSLVRQVETAGAAAAAGHWWSPPCFAAACFAMAARSAMAACLAAACFAMAACFVIAAWVTASEMAFLMVDLSTHALSSRGLESALWHGLASAGVELTAVRPSVVTVAQAREESAVREHGLPPLRPVGNVASGHRHPSGFASSAM